MDYSGRHLHQLTYRVEELESLGLKEEQDVVLDEGKEKNH